MNFNTLGSTHKKQQLEIRRLDNKISTQLDDEVS